MTLVPSSMRLVLDTNVLVAALLHPGRVPDRALAQVRVRGLGVLYDARIECEYRSVLARPKFARAIDPARAAVMLDALLDPAWCLPRAAPFVGAMTDEDDRAFVEVALAGHATAIVTGNARHYPTGLGFDVLTPADFLARMTSG